MANAAKQPPTSPRIMVPMNLLCQYSLQSWSLDVSLMYSFIKLYLYIFFSQQVDEMELGPNGLYLDVSDMQILNFLWIRLEVAAADYSDSFEIYYFINQLCQYKQSQLLGCLAYCNYLWFIVSKYYLLYFVGELILQNIKISLMNQNIDPIDSSNYCCVPVKFQNQTQHLATNPIGKTLFDDIKQTPGENEKKQCRICLQGEEEGKMIFPCKCTGSVKYTHSRCLVEWIKRKVTQNPKLKAKCQLCDTEFNYRVRNNRYFDCSQLARNYARNKSSIRSFAIVYSFFVLLFLGIIALLIVAYSNVSQSIKQALIPNSTTVVIYVTLIILFFVILFVVAILFISEYVVREEISITDANSYKPQPSFLKNYKIYYRR